MCGASMIFSFKFIFIFPFDDQIKNDSFKGIFNINLLHICASGL